MTAQPTALNTDTGGIPTSAEFADDGDGTNRWLLWARNAALGTPQDPKVQDPDAASASIVALLRGILEAQRPLSFVPEIQATSGPVANAVATATLPASATQTTFITGLSVSFDGATAGAPVQLTLTGITTPLSVVINVPTLPAVQAAPFVVSFSRPIPASAVNTPIVVSLPALGAGNTIAIVTATGFQA